MATDLAGRRRMTTVALLALSVTGRSLGLWSSTTAIGVATLVEVALVVVLARGVLAVRARGGDPWEEARLRIAAMTTGFAASLLLAELRVQIAFFGWLARRAPRPYDPRAFTAWRASARGRRVAFVATAVVLDAVVCHLLARAIGDEGVRVWVRVASGAAHGYVAMWLVGDWQAIRQSAHRLGLEGMRIELGARWSGFLPYALIEDVREATAPDDDRRRDEAHVTPREAANVVVRLRCPITLRTLAGERVVASLRLFVDEPRRLVMSLRASGRTGVARDHIFGDAASVRDGEVLRAG